VVGNGICSFKCYISRLIFCMHFSYPHACYMGVPYPSHSPWYDHPSYIKWIIHMKILVILLLCISLNTFSPYRKMFKIKVTYFNHIDTLGHIMYQHFSFEPFQRKTIILRFKLHILYWTNVRQNWIRCTAFGVNSPYIIWSNCVQYIPNCYMRTE
jgi:hypothetical protein